MRSSIKRSFGLILTGLLVISIMGCGSSKETAEPISKAETPKGGTTITIGMKATHVELSNINYHKEKWEKETGNRIEIQAVDDNQFEQMMLTKMTSGGMWDMFVGDTGTQSLKYKHADNLVDLSGEAWVSNLSDVGKDFVTVDGKVYCFPKGGINSFGIVYNREVFEQNKLQVPKTYDEFNAVSEKLKAAGITPIYISMKDGWTVNQIMNGEWPNILVKNPQALDQLNKNEIRWDSIPEFVNMFERMKQWVDNDWVNADLATANYEMAQKALGEGKAAMMYMGDWADPEYIKTVPEAAGKLGMFAAPSADGKSYLAAAGPGGLYISKQSKNIDVAKSFIKYLASDEAIKYDLETNKSTTVWKHVTSSNLSGTLSDSQKYFDDNMSQKHYNQTYIITPPAESESALLSILLGQETPEKAAKIWSDEIIKVGKQLGFEGFTK